MILPEEIERMEQDARRFAGAYTGTSGTLAGHVIRLLRDRDPAKISGMRRTDWINASESLPEIGQEVLVTARRRIAIASIEVDIKGRQYWESIDDDFVDAGPDITHWMPLPEPPR